MCREQRRNLYVSPTIFWCPVPDARIQVEDRFWCCCASLARQFPVIDNEVTKLSSDSGRETLSGTQKFFCFPQFRSSAGYWERSWSLQGPTADLTEG
jgi:hypothetical protein